MLIDTRKARAQNPVAKKIYDLIQRKHSNVVLSLDITEQKKFFRILEKTADNIIGLKVHADIIKDFNTAFIKRLLLYKEKFDFILIEDRKFADIGNTVKAQYQEGVIKILDWADLVTVHVFPGEGVVAGLREAWIESHYKERGALLISQMSTKNNFFTEATVEAAVALGKEYCDFIVGFIGAPSNKEHISTSSQNLLGTLKASVWEEFLIFSPGVNMRSGDDLLGQSYIPPSEAVLQGADCIIVGRGIYEAEDPITELLNYKEQAWHAFVKREEQDI